MEFAISGEVIHPAYLVAVGFVIGALGGFFGVGGSFLAGPALYAVGVPMNYVVGTDMAHITGKSIVAARHHRALGNVDIKLGLLMVIGTVLGVEIGAQAIEALERRGNVEVPVGLGFTVILLGVSALIAWESWRTIRSGSAVQPRGAASWCVARNTPAHRHAPLRGLARRHSGYRRGSWCACHLPIRSRPSAPSRRRSPSPPRPSSTSPGARPRTPTRWPRRSWPSVRAR